MLTFRYESSDGRIEVASLNDSSESGHLKVSAGFGSWTRDARHISASSSLGTNGKRAAAIYPIGLHVVRGCALNTAFSAFGNYGISLKS
jgi:hypothetical protein